MQGSVADFLLFLKTSPTPYHAVNEIKTRLQARGFEQLHERSDWASSCEAGKRYFVIREASTIAAFAIGYLWKVRLSQCKVRRRPLTSYSQGTQSVSLLHTPIRLACG